MGDLVDGTFTVFGKVTKIIQEDGSLNLIRNTAFGKFSHSRLEELFNILNKALTNDTFSFPDIKFTVPAPVIQILPIAIYT